MRLGREQRPGRKLLSGLLTRGWRLLSRLLHPCVSLVARFTEPPRSELSALPSMDEPVSQLVTQTQCDSAVFDRWCRDMRLDPEPRIRYHRKTWEWVYILQSLATSGALAPGARGLGFGVGREPVTPVLARLGCRITATDLPHSPKAESDWEAHGQHASSRDHLNTAGICDGETFAQNVSFRPMDMRDIDPSLQNFDFLWSSCALEHLGNLADGIQFILRSLESLRPGGVAVHTTEFNLTSDRLTLSRGGVVLYRRRDIDRLAAQLRKAGHSISLNFSSGSGPADRYIDKPPYFRGDYHLKLLVGPFVTTSMGLLIRKAPA
jgi:SAM-dependent methyltransferase